MGDQVPASAGSGRPYALASKELARPAALVQAERTESSLQSQQEWRWIWLAGFCGAVLFGYTTVWPWMRTTLYSDTPLRRYLLPPSTHPVQTVAGVQVGWFWVMFIAAPIAMMLAAAAWAGLVALSNRAARRGHTATLQAGQEWTGVQFPAGALICGVGGVTLFAGGALLRWATPATTLLIGQLLLMGVYGAAGLLFWQFTAWARGRAAITKKINAITYYCAPVLGWPDYRAGRVTVRKTVHPRRHAAYAKVVELYYAQHPRDITEAMLADIAACLLMVTALSYAIEHDTMHRRLTARYTPAIEAPPVPREETVLAPLVANWFDSNAVVSGVQLTDLEEGADLANETDREFTSRIREFTIKFVYNAKVDSPYRRIVIESKVADALQGTWEPDWNLVARTVKFVRYPGLPPFITPKLDFPEVRRDNIIEIYQNTVLPFGEDAYGNVIGWDFRLSPHCLIAGSTGAGKTRVMLTLALGGARRGMQVVWIDPKGFDTPGLRIHPNVSLVTAGFDDDGLVAHTAGLRLIADTMRDRYTKIKFNPSLADTFEPILCIFDEFSNLAVELQAFYRRYKQSEDKGGPPTDEDVATILRTARAVGIHLVIGLQRPDTVFIGGEARDNTALRIAVGRLRSKEAAIMMFNDSVAGTRLEPGIKGRATVQLPDNSIREVQMYYTPTLPATDEQQAQLSDDDRKILEAFTAVDTFWPRRVVNSVLREFDPENPPTFAQIRDSEIVLASARPDLDPADLERFVPPTPPVRRATLDDDTEPAKPQFGGPVDGFDDDYMPDYEDEYGQPGPMQARDLQHGDLIELPSVDGPGGWHYICGDPGITQDANGADIVFIPFSKPHDSQCLGNIEVDPSQIFQVRQLYMQD